MINCKNCGAPIDIYSGRCPYCGTPYEAPGGSETGEKLGRERMQSWHSCALMDSVMTPNEYRKTVEICRFDSVFGEMKTLHAVRERYWE